jgi:hypothetical protein
LAIGAWIVQAFRRKADAGATRASLPALQPGHGASAAPRDGGAADHHDRGQPRGLNLMINTIQTEKVSLSGGPQFCRRSASFEWRVDAVGLMG